MVIWGSDELKTPRARVSEPRSESQDVLADAKSWGFGHGIRHPRPSIAGVVTSR
jgi:hypothetical protein